MFLAVPVAVERPSIREKTQTSFVVVWTQPSPANGIIVNYEVVLNSVKPSSSSSSSSSTVARDGSGGPSDGSRHDTTNLEMDFEHLEPGTAYYVKVRELGYE